MPANTVQDAAFAALAHPVRRRLLELLLESPRTAGSLASEFELSRPAVSEHLAALRRSGLVVDHVRGRERYYELARAPWADIGEWLRPFEGYWRARLRDLDDVLGTPTDASTPRSEHHA